MQAWVNCCGMALSLAATVPIFLQTLQVEHGVLRALPTYVGIFREAVNDQSFERRRHVRSDTAERRRVFAQDRGDEAG
jgi:hypothetical protein